LVFVDVFFFLFELSSASGRRCDRVAICSTIHSHGTVLLDPRALEPWSWSPAMLVVQLAPLRTPKKDIQLLDQV